MKIWFGLWKRLSEYFLEKKNQKKNTKKWRLLKNVENGPYGVEPWMK